MLTMGVASQGQSVDAAQGARQQWLTSGNANIDPSTNFLGTTDNQPIIFKTNGSEVLKMGTTGGGGEFKLRETIGSGDTEMVLEHTGGSTFSLRVRDADGTFNIRDVTAGGLHRLTITPNGNVGIGIETPQRKLHINDLMRLKPRAAAPGSPSKGDIYVDSTTNELCFYDGTAWTGLKAAGTCE